MSLSVFYHCICAFLCHCHSFNPSVCHIMPVLLSYVTVPIVSIVGATAEMYQQRGPTLLGATYVPCLNFKTGQFEYRGLEDMSLSVFYHCICAFLCHSHSFNLSVCHIMPVLLSYVTVSRPCRLSEFYLNRITARPKVRAIKLTENSSITFKLFSLHCMQSS